MEVLVSTMALGSDSAHFLEAPAFLLPHLLRSFLALVLVFVLVQGLMLVQRWALTWALHYCSIAETADAVRRAVCIL